MASRPASFTEEMTSSSRSAAPAAAPAATEVSIPRRPPVFGTMTLFTFFIRLPLSATFIRSGRFPSASRTLAAA